MKRLTSLITATLIFALGGTTVRGQNTRYFDVNDDLANSGVANSGTYPWDTTTPSWNSNANGAGTSPGTTVAWVNNDNAVFSAGSDATGIRYLLNIAGGTTANAAVIEEGTVVINTGVFDTGAGTADVLAGATLETKTSNQFNGGGVLKLSGGRLLGSNTSSGGTLLSNLKTIEINGSGTIEYTDGTATERTSNVSGNVITGTGGSPSTGGAGTLVKAGADVIAYAGLDTGGGNFNWQLNSFAKLSVRQGSFRIAKTTVGGLIDERLFGAVPVNTLTDAITLDGGGIGTNQTLTLDVKRGITIGATGGYFDHGAGGSINVPGPVTAAAGALLTIGSATSITPTTAVFEFSNPNNVSTFQGNVFMLRNTLQLDSSLKVAHFSGTGLSSTTFGTVRIASGTTLTVGSDSLDASFDGSIADLATGPGSGGIFTKAGAGTLTLNTVSGAAWSNTGGINIANGSIKYASSTAGFNNATAVSIGATGKLNMNGISDTFGSLSGPTGGIVDMKETAMSAGALTLGAASGSTTYSGSITGGGNLTKSGGATQVLAGDSTLGTVAVNSGALLNNATMTTGGGITVGANGVLGGTGMIAGAVSNSGVIAPGNGGIGTLSVSGNVTNNAGAIWHIELSGGTSDKLAVTGNIDLQAAGDFLSVTGTGTGSSWLIGTYTGTELGIFDNITSGYTVSYTGGNIVLNATAPGLPGDFNSDGNVDAGDYVTWRKNDVANAALMNDNGVGNQAARYSLWRANFGNPPGAGSGLSGGAVPEPASFGLLVIGLAAFSFGRRGRVA
jgi:hypothetical protein